MNNLKMIIYCLITGIIVFTGSIYASTKYMANQIAYTTEYNNKITTAEDAMNDLYKTTSNYMSGKYSEEETVVGEWIDGKPIYRKVFINNDGFVNISGHGWFSNYLSTGILDCDSIIDIRLYGEKATFQHLYNTFTKETGMISSFCPTNDTYGLIKKVIIEYTKTTD